MRRYYAAGVLAALVSVIFLSFMVGCSGTSSTVAPVSQIVFSPTSLSLNPAQVTRLVATPENSSGGAVVADVSFSSSNTALVTVSPAGFVCAGVWDSNYIVCNPNSGLSAVGQATITATSGSVSNTAQVNVHLQADRIAVNPISGCVSMGATPTYTASVFNTTSPGCSPTSPCDITSTVGNITFVSTDLQVMTNNGTTGVLTATNPGATNIYASVAGLNSLPTPALVCPVASIKIHDANGSGTSFTLARLEPSPDRRCLDGHHCSSAVGSGDGKLSVTGNSGAVTQRSPQAHPEPPSSPPRGTNCNRGVAPIRPDVIAVTTTGSTTTAAFASTSSTLVPIPSGTTTGTVINLPFLPNSVSSQRRHAVSGRVRVMSVNPVVPVASTLPSLGRCWASPPTDCTC